MLAGVLRVRQMSTEDQSVSSLLACTDGAGPSEMRTTRPFSSCPVTTHGSDGSSIYS
jgi:hypothetical protein